MRDIPLDLERRFEQRWAARFSGPANEHRLEGQQRHQRVAAPDKSKPRRRRTGGLANADLSRRPVASHESRERRDRQASCIVSAVLRVRPIVGRVLLAGLQAAAYRC
jgi:hypothetical protein